ncbi:MAG: abortive infection family protein [Sphingomonas sp.]|nr:abortive infection family protein [Sphingomonas sp.]
MVQIKRSELRSLDDAFAMHSGYVLDFSDRTMSEWFEDELRIDIDDERYKRRGTSKANRLRTFVEDEPEQVVARALRALWKYREQSGFTPYGIAAEDVERHRATLFDLIHKIEGQEATPATDSIIAFTRDETLEELVQAIRRDADAGRPQAALDRLHTYSMKKFAFLLDRRGAPADREEPLHSRVGRYVKLLEAERPLRPITKQILKNCIGIFQTYNDVRNNASFAHDNSVVDKDEARFIFETVISMLRFVRAVEVGQFETLGEGAL